jgi:hypothetical protein
MSDDAIRSLAEKAFEDKRLHRVRLARLPIEQKLEILLELQRTVNEIARAVGRPTKPEWPREIVPSPGAGDAETPPEWLEEFEAAAGRPLKTRFRYAFIKTHRPVLDDAPFRAFDSTEGYRRWCEENLPDWLGYGRV